jgi:hypothetical protein
MEGGRKCGTTSKMWSDEIDDAFHSKCAWLERQFIERNGSMLKALL